MKSCKNCHFQFEGNYCPNCGQKYIDKRLTLKESVYWIFNSIFNVERGFFYTSKLIIVHPGKVILDFLRGITIKYVHPFRFVFIWATISAILMLYTTALEDSSTMFSGMSDSKSQSEFSKAWLVYMKQYMSFFIMFMIPLTSTASYLVLKKKKFHYAEHLVVNAYANGASIIVGLPIACLYFFLENTQPLGLISMGLSIIVIGRVYAQCFGDKLLIGILKYLLTFIITMVFFMLLFIIVVIVVSLVMHYLGMPNPFAPTS